MGNDFKKQTSTISANQALKTLFANNFKVLHLTEYTPLDDIKQAYRKDVIDARRTYGNDAAISTSGRSITLVGAHIASGAIVEVLVPLSGMLGHGALKALQEKTGVVFKA